MSSAGRASRVLPALPSPPAIPILTPRAHPEGILPLIITNPDLNEHGLVDIDVSGPLSPASAVTFIAAHGAGLSRTSFHRLAAALAEQADRYRTEHDGARDETRDLAAQIADLHIAEARALGNDPPEGFIENRGQVPDFYISTGDGGHRLTPYICKVARDHSRVEGTLGGVWDPIYSHTLRAAPYDSLNFRAYPLPSWFTRFLTGREVFGRLMEREANKLGDWGLAAEMRHYREVHHRLASLREELQRIEDELSLAHRQTADSRLRLEEAGAPKRLAHLEFVRTTEEGEILYPNPFKSGDVEA